MDLPSKTGRGTHRGKRDGCLPKPRPPKRGARGAAGTEEPRHRRPRAAGGGGRIASLAFALLALAGMASAILNAVPEIPGATVPPAAPLPRAMTGADGARPTPRPTPTDRASAERIPAYQTDLHASSIRIPALGVTAGIGWATLRDGVLSPPVVPMEVGLWTGSAPLDAAYGEVTLIGHVDWFGMPPFAFGRLAYLRAGDLVYTTDRYDVQTAWRIIGVTARPKADGVDPGAFYGPRGRRALVLITCGGAFDASSSSYDDNVYAYAIPVHRSSGVLHSAQR